jgi:hypothetical protein
MMKKLSVISALAAGLLLQACAAPAYKTAPLAPAQETKPVAPAGAPMQELPVVAPAPVQAEKNFARFLRWFTGEFNNNEQVWQQKQDAEKTATGVVQNPFEHIHHIFAPIQNQALGANLFFVKQYLNNDPSKIYRQRLYRLSESSDGTVRLEIFAFQKEAAQRDLHLDAARASALTLGDLRATPGCDVFWRFAEAEKAYIGTMQKDACKIQSKQSAKTIVINDTLRLSESEIWIADVATDTQGNHVWGRKDGLAHKNRKVRYFTGWLYINRAGHKAENWQTKFSPGKVKLHTEGDRQKILFDDNTASGYTLELAQLTYQNTKVPILKFALIEDSTGKSMTYIWSDTDAGRIGMNLRWFQSGLTEKEDKPHFGF